MSQFLQTPDATLVTPGSFATFRVAAEAAGLPTSGVIMLVGEADGGPDYTLETRLADNSFGPGEIGDVAAKYRSGPLLDAFRAAVRASADPRIVGAPSRIIIAKTNVSTKATAQLKRWDTTNYGVLADRSYGSLGNLISWQVKAQASEVIPTTAAFTFIPAVGTVAYNVRANGGAALTGGLLGANTLPDAFVTAIDALTGVAATGGANLATLTGVAGNIALTALAGNTVQIDTVNNLNAIPAVGSTVVLPSGSAIAGGASQNVGAYVVTGSSAKQILATKLSDAGKGGGVPGAITPPLTVAATAISGTPANDLKGYGSVTITLETADPIDGVGKTLAISELTTGTDLLSRTAYQLGTATAVTWVSKTGAPQVLVSATEYSADLAINRANDDVSQDAKAGGEIALLIQYTGTTATITLADSDADGAPNTLATTVTGGSGAGLSLTLKDYKTLSDLAAYINTRTGYTCTVGSGILGQLPATALDCLTTQGICSTFGAVTGRLKVDAYKFARAIQQNTALVQLQDSLGDVQRATSGLPKNTAAADFLAGGTKGGTLAAAVTGAIDALQKARGNFLVTCISRDATADIADGDTESTSTYTVAATNAAAKSHVLDCSKIKRKRNRQAFVSIQDTFANAKAAAANLANFRVACTFQDVKDLGTDGLLHQFPPYVGAAKAAGLQAAGFYRAIFKKSLNISGVIQNAGDFDDNDDDAMEQALISGLLPIRQNPDGGFEFVSDQTTYGSDNNFVFNSIQLVYMADTLSLGLSNFLEKAFVGENISDVPADLIASRLDAKLGEYLRTKVISADDTAPKGYRNLRIKIAGPAARVTLEAKPNGSIYFIPLDITLSQVTQSAGP